mmetsp:Transcript_26154/g.47717  ORF Transcript_26154/g.47717 Transcript_26154/m.47717 type:complete len:209 (+) Transcript_26154:142-768(+)
MPRKVPTSRAQSSGRAVMSSYKLDITSHPAALKRFALARVWSRRHLISLQCARAYALTPCALCAARFATSASRASPRMLRGMAWFLVNDWYWDTATSYGFLVWNTPRQFLFGRATFCEPTGAAAAAAAAVAVVSVSWAVCSGGGGARAAMAFDTFRIKAGLGSLRVKRIPSRLGQRLSKSSDVSGNPAPFSPSMMHGLELRCARPLNT